MSKATTEQPTQKRPRKMVREPIAPASNANETAPGVPAVINKRTSKSALVVALLSRPDGATIEQIVDATGWLPHTCRAALTGLRKNGHTVTSNKMDGRSRIYRTAIW